MHCTMTTLLITHPACLEHLTPPGHPERPDRLRAVEHALAHERFQSLVRVEAPAGRARYPRALPSDAIMSLAMRDATPKQGIVRIDADTVDVARQFRGGAAGGRRRGACGRRGDRGPRQERLRGDAPARPSHRDLARDGLLPVQQRRDRGAPRTEEARRRPRRDRRFRRASRQRLAGDLLVGSDRDVLLDPPDAALSRHRRGQRARRARHHRQCAAAAGRRRTAVQGGVRSAASCRG